VTTDSNVPRIYRALLRLYPRQFRAEYGADMAVLLKNQLRDEPAWRVCGRAAIDLAITVPTQQLETHMTRTPNRTVPLIYTGLAVAAAAMAIVGGTNAGAFIVGLLLAFAAGVMALISWRRVLPLRDRDVTRHWWAFVLAGPVLIGAVIIASGLGVEAWFLGILCVLTAFALTAIGLTLAVIRLVTTRTPSVSA